MNYVEQKWRPSKLMDLSANNSSHPGAFIFFSFSLHFRQSECCFYFIDCCVQQCTNTCISMCCCNCLLTFLLCCTLVVVEKGLNVIFSTFVFSLWECLLLLLVWIFYFYMYPLSYFPSKS